MVLFGSIEKRAVENINNIEGLLRREVRSRPNAFPMFPIEL